MATRPVGSLLRTIALPAVLGLVGGAPSATADVYAFVNDDGDYVVSRNKPDASVAEYAVLTDDGEFLRLVHPRELDVPVTHWRPWFLPREPDPYDGDPDAYREREGTVDIEEVGSDEP